MDRQGNGRGMAGLISEFGGGFLHRRTRPRPPVAHGFWSYEAPRSFSRTASAATIPFGEIVQTAGLAYSISRFLWRPRSRERKFVGFLYSMAARRPSSLCGLWS